MKHKDGDLPPQSSLLLSGFGNEHSSEALPNSLPLLQNSPQHCPHGLYAEQLSGTAFTVPRVFNKRTWLYRTRPSCKHAKLTLQQEMSRKVMANYDKLTFSPAQMRWSPFFEKNGLAEEHTRLSWLHGLRLIGQAGDPSIRHGLAIYVYGFGQSMGKSAFYNADGDFLLVPQQGVLEVRTEMGYLRVEPEEIVVIPRGIKFAINPIASFEDNDDKAQHLHRGYVLEIFAGHFELPELGPIGANGLAHPGHFKYPQASFEQNLDILNDEHYIYSKYCGNFYQATSQCPFDVVAWKGNYAPFKYDLRLFQTINTVSFDHCDPSIFTVLTARSPIADNGVSGTALADLAIFPPRWSVGEHTFRPPYYHRNVMSEFMGLIKGSYEAKRGEEFEPGGATLHPLLSAHGVDATAFQTAVDAKQLQPVRVAEGTMAFMFETSLMLGLTAWALQHAQPDYNERAWSNLKPAQEFLF